MTVGQIFTKIGNLLNTDRYSCCYIVIVQSLLILKIFKHAWGPFFSWTRCTYIYAPVVTNWLAWSVGRSVCLSWSWTLLKLLNWSRCHLEYGFGCAQGACIRWVHIGTTWWISLNGPFVVAVRSFLMCWSVTLFIGRILQMTCIWYLMHLLHHTFLEDSFKYYSIYMYFLKFLTSSMTYGLK